MAKTYGQCTYCHRHLTSAADRAGTAATTDHVMPKSVGGVRKVRCCRQCNQLKGDLHPSLWRWFAERYPRWWKQFRTNREVREACRMQFGPAVRASAVGRAPRAEMERRCGQLLPSGAARWPQPSR